MRILDLSHRLPGPMAGKVLADLGCEVIKIEDQVLKDPFLDGFFAAFDPSFTHWYEELNQKKKIIRLDFNSTDIKKYILDECKRSDGVILSLSPRLKNQLGITPEELRNLSIAVIELSGSKTNKPMHDLNALMDSGFLKLYIQDFDQDILPPPFLPFAGIAFGQHVATTLLMKIHQAQKEKKLQWDQCYLLETIEGLWAPFWNKKDQSEKRYKFLHNGAYPCYSLYRLKNGSYLGLAAVEEKFWNNFAQAFNIPLSKEDRFKNDPKIFKIISDQIKSKPVNEVEKLLSTYDMCASILEKI